MTKLSCDVCGITAGSEESFKLHVEGKPHKKELARQTQLNELVLKSVFLTSFKHSPSEEIILETLSEFGQVDRIILDKKAGKFAIVEFSTAEPVQTLLQKKSIQVGEDKVNVKKRKVDFAKPEPKSGSLTGINEADLLKFTQQKLRGDLRIDLQAIYEQYKRKSTQIVDVFLPQLSTFIQAYFNEEIKLMVFGSTATGLATYDADVDICFISKEPNDETFSLQTSSSNIAKTSDVMLQSVSDLRESRIPMPAFNALKKSDQVKLLTRIFNEFRKQTNLIDSLQGVGDAKCPVVRFNIPGAGDNGLDLECEVSVNNFLGMHKSLFVKNSLNEDLLLILFCIRIWGKCFKLFKQSDDSVGHWSSYALSLVFVQFCQVKGFISEVKIEGPEQVNGWDVQYSVSEKPSPQWGLDEFLLNFFKFTASIFNQPTVLSVRNGRLYKIDEFKEEFKGKVADNFKFSLVNVQDPIELSHNVTANVSSDFLKTLRGQSMRVLCNLKANPPHPIPALFAGKAQKPGTAASFVEPPTNKRRKLN